MLNGQKTFITNGGNANLIIVACRTGGEGSKGMSLVVVETEHAQGFRRGRLLDKIGMKAQDTAELFFDDLRVPAHNLLGAAEGQGFVQLMQQLPQERLIVALGGIAAMERALAETLAYVKERKAFGKTIWEFQNTRFKLAEVQATVLAARAMVDAAMVASPARRTRRGTRRAAQILGHRAAGQGDGRMPAALRRLRLHERIPDRRALRCACSSSTAAPTRSRRSWRRASCEARPARAQPRRCQRLAQLALDEAG